MQQYKNLIDGEWVDSSDGKTFENRNPAQLDDILGEFPLATKADVERAIDAASAALPAWGNLPGPARGAILDKASRILEARMDEIATVLTREEGKTLTEAKGEVTRARDIFRYYAGEGWRAGGGCRRPWSTRREKSPLGSSSISSAKREKSSRIKK